MRPALAAATVSPLIQHQAMFIRLYVEALLGDRLMGREDCLHPFRRAPLDYQQGLEKDQVQQRRELRFVAHRLCRQTAL